MSATVRTRWSMPPTTKVTGAGYRPAAGSAAPTACGGTAAAVGAGGVRGGGAHAPCGGAAMDRGGGTPAVLELFETAQVVAMTLDVDGRITWCNGYLSELTGLTRDELVGRDFFATFEPERGPDAMRDLIGRVLAGDRET